METLTELKQWILDDPDNRVACLKDADFYLVQYDEHRDRFLLPARFVHIRPVVEAFAGDSLAFAQWLRDFARTYFFRTSDVAQFITRLANHAQSRGIVRRRRLLSKDAVDTAIRLGKIKDTVAERRRYALAFNNHVKAEYKKLMDARRNASPNRRIGRDELNDMAASFWDDINQTILAGEIPDL